MQEKRPVLPAPTTIDLMYSCRTTCSTGSERTICIEEQRWDDDQTNDLLDAARLVLDAAGGWQTHEDDHGEDPASLHRLTELYFSEGVRCRIWPYVDLMNRGIEVGDLEDLRLGVLGHLRIVLCTERGPE